MRSYNIYVFIFLKPVIMSVSLCNESHIVQSGLRSSSISISLHLGLTLSHHGRKIRRGIKKTVHAPPRRAGPLSAHRRRGHVVSAPLTNCESKYVLVRQTKMQKTMNPEVKPPRAMKVSHNRLHSIYGVTIDCTAFVASQSTA